MPQSVTSDRVRRLFSATLAALIPALAGCGSSSHDIRVGPSAHSVRKAQTLTRSIQRHDSPVVDLSTARTITTEWWQGVDEEGKKLDRAYFRFHPLHQKLWFQVVLGNVDMIGEVLERRSYEGELRGIIQRPTDLSDSQLYISFSNQEIGEHLQLEFDRTPDGFDFVASDWRFQRKSILDARLKKNSDKTPAP